jgi:hypothetical protein
MTLIASLNLILDMKKILRFIYSKCKNIISSNEWLLKSGIPISIIEKKNLIVVNYTLELHCWFWGCLQYAGGSG